MRVRQAERGSRRTRRHPRDDPRAEVGEDVRVGVDDRFGAVECQLNSSLYAMVCSLVWSSRVGVGRCKLNAQLLGGGKIWRGPFMRLSPTTKNWKVHTFETVLSS